MPKRRAALRAAAEGGSRAPAVKVVLVSLALCLTASGLAWAGWGRSDVSRKAEPHGARPPAATAPAPPPPQSFSPQSPAKEYVYAGSRLVATEEPSRLDQVITFGLPADKTYGDAPFALSATASSGLPVSLSITSGPATVSGNTVTITGAGTVTVKADQAGNTDYNPAPGVTRTFTVAKATASVTLSNLVQTYNGSPRSAAATTNPSGLAVTFTYNGSPSAPTNAGSYTVVASLAHANYSAPSVSGTMAVAKATPVITWNNPADIPHGTALSAAQLNATANTSGTFAYTPGAGTLLGVGNSQQLSAAFTPADSANYNNASAAVRINVIGCATAGASSFTATSPIGMGKSSALSWNVPYATGVTVSGVVGSFGASGSTVVTPAATTTYTLAASSAPVCPTQPLTMQATVVVMPCPVASQTTFTADSYLLQPGGSARLDWSAPDAATVHIYATTACAPSQICMTQVYSGTGTGGSISVSPTQTTTYVLWADNDALNCDRVEKQLTVETANASCSPGAYFSHGQMPPGDQLDYLNGIRLLEWSVPNATGVTITDQTGADYGSYGASGQIYVDSRFTTKTYTLRAQIAGPACSPFVLRMTVECSMDCSGSSLSE